MGLNTTLSRLLSDPDARERAVLEADIADVLRGNRRISSSTNAPVVEVHENIAQRFILVTQDKTLLTLKRNIARLGKKEWIAPLSTLTTITIALITSNFKYALGLGPAEWRAIFIVCGFVAAGWLFATLRRSMNSDSFHEVICNICYELGAREKPCTEQEKKTGILETPISASAVIAACKTRRKRSTKRRSKK